jgi:hypothetical protein
MSNAPVHPPQIEPHHPVPIEEDEGTPASGVRKMLDAFEERDLSRIRWSSVLAGLFLALGALTLLGLLGVAVGLSVLDLRAANPLARLSVGLGIWMGFSALIALFVGSFAAAKLGGSIRRGDGMLAGALTWAASLALVLAIGGASSRSLVVEEDGGAETTSLLIADRSVQFVPTPEARIEKAQMARAAWAAFGGAVISLVAAGAGGALGAVGKRKGERPRAPRPPSSDEQIPLY